MDNPTESKWDLILDDTSVRSVSSLRFNLSIDLNFSEIRILYSTKFEKAYRYRQRNNKEELENFMTETLEILG